MRKSIVLLTTLALTLGSVASVSAQDRWDGRDDLPTSPLACPGSDEVVEPLESGTYDGGQPVDAPDLAGQPITLIDLPKLIGIGYYAATTKGMEEAAAELGNVEVSTDGPTAANIDEQVQFIDNYITRGVNGILFAANDPVAIGPVLTEALEAGIDVIGYDANSVPEAREWFVNQAGFREVGKAMIDSLVAEKGEDAVLRHRHHDLHHAQPGALDRRDERLRRQVFPEPEVARDARGPGGRAAVLQSGPDAPEQVR